MYWTILDWKQCGIKQTKFAALVEHIFRGYVLDDKVAMWLVTGALVRIKNGVAEEEGRSSQVWLSRFCTAQPSKDAQSRQLFVFPGKNTG